MNPLNETKKQFRTTLLDQGAKDAIESLQQYIHTENPKQNTLLAIEGRRKEILNQRHKGVQYDNDFRVEQNKIRDDILSFIDEISKNDHLPPSPKKKLKTTLTDKRTIFAGIGVLAIIILTSIFIPKSSNLPPAPYLFDIEGQSLAFRSDGTIMISQMLGEELDRIYVSVDGSGDYFDKDTTCQCWKVDLERYHLNEGKHSLRIAPDQLALQDENKYPQNAIKIDNTIAEGLFTAESTTGKDTTLVEVKGIANEKVNLDISLPFDQDSTNSSFQIIEDTDGYYFFQEIKIPNELVAKYKDAQIPIFISDDAGNQIGSAVTLDMLEKGNVPPMFFGEHYKYFAEANQQIVIANLPIEPQQQPAPQATQPPSNESKDDSLTLRVAFFSEKMIGLEWQLKNVRNREIEYTLYKRIAKGVLKDTISDFVKVDYFSTTAYNDSAVKEGYVYEYYVEARDPNTDRMIKSSNVRRGIPPALKQMAERLQQAKKADTKTQQNSDLARSLSPESEKLDEALQAELEAVIKAIEEESSSIFPWKRGDLSQELQKRVVTLIQSLPVKTVYDRYNGYNASANIISRSKIVSTLIKGAVRDEIVDDIYTKCNFNFILAPDARLVRIHLDGDPDSLWKTIRKSPISYFWGSSSLNIKCNISIDSYSAIPITFHSNLEYIPLYKVSLPRVDFSSTNLKLAFMNGGDFSDAIFYKSDLQGAFLEYSVLNNTDFRRASLINAHLKEAKLIDADLEGANLFRANLQGANLQGANLQGANLEGANLFGANLQGANLQGANLFGAILKRTDFENANLKETWLCGVAFSNTNLYKAQLKGARVFDYHLGDITAVNGDTKGLIILKVEKCIKDIIESANRYHGPVKEKSALNVN